MIVFQIFKRPEERWTILSREMEGTKKIKIKLPEMKTTMLKLKKIHAQL